MVAEEAATRRCDVFRPSPGPTRRGSRESPSGSCVGSVAVATVTLGRREPRCRGDPVTDGGPEDVPPKTVLLVGDSLLHQAATGISDVLPGTNVVDASVPGIRSSRRPGGLGGSRAAELSRSTTPTSWSCRSSATTTRPRGRSSPTRPRTTRRGPTAAQQLTAIAPRPPGPASTGSRSRRCAIRTSTASPRPERRSCSSTTAGWRRSPASHSSTRSTRSRRPPARSPSRRDVCGSAITLRIADGVHFTDTGGDWWGANLGRAVAVLEDLPARTPAL